LLFKWKRSLTNFLEKPIHQSVLIHALLVFLFTTLTVLDQKTIDQTFEFTIVESEVKQIKKQPKVVINATKDKAITKKPKKKLRQVYGLKRKAQTSKEGTVVAKKGNTLTKKEDDKILRKDDPDSLPEPAEEFLLTSMPRALEEFRPDYPKWAKDQGITGSVIFEILIDKYGKVRKATLLKSLHPELDALAKEAMMKFKFKPAYIEKKPAAVKIKYAIRYVLET
jgi:TonB family protein